MSGQCSSFRVPYTAMVQGASRGIGRELVGQLLADPGAGSVIATCRSIDRAAALQDLAARDKRLHLLAMDITDEASVMSAASALRAADTKIDLLINCAGVLHDASGMRPERRLADIDPDHLVRGYRVNAIGPLLVAKHFEALLGSNDKAVFASLSARVGSLGDNRLGGWYGYRASKAAQNMITRNLSIELRRRRPRIICVALHPGTVDTDLSAPFQKNVPPTRLFSTERAAHQLLVLIESLDVDSNGRFFAWDGREIPW